MATIIVTRGLNGLTSAFNQCSIEFTISTGVAPKATITGIDFFCVKTATNVGGLDTYLFDLTDKFPYLLGFPPDDYESVSAYSKSVSIALSAPATTTVTISTIVSFAIDKIKELGSSVSDIQSQGRRFNAYTNGRVGFYFGGSPGTYTLTMNGTIDADYSLVNGYNIITLNGLHQRNGSISISGYDIDFYVYYYPVKYSSDTNELVKWIDADGNFNEWDFRLISTSPSVKPKNSVSVYRPVMGDVFQLSKNISKEKKVSYSLSTVAIDTDHYRQLASISDSVAVYYDDKILQVKDISDTISECRQNLKFNLVLEGDDYVPTY